MVFRRLAIALCFSVICLAVSAKADNSVGTFSDFLVGCDNPGACGIAFDENGNVTAHMNGFFGPYNWHAYAIAPTVNPAWVDSSGAPVEVFSYIFGGTGGIANLDLVSGVIGICEFGLNTDGSCANNGDMSDVIIITNLGGGENRIDFLSDNENYFPFATDINVGEVNGSGPNGQDPGSYAYADYTGVGESGGGERFSYHAVSEGQVPEPSSMILLGSGFLGAIGTIRRKLNR